MKTEFSEQSSMEARDKLTHPLYTKIELHFLPHQRAFNRATETYCAISDKNLITIPHQSRRSLDFDKFKLECKLGIKLNKNEVIDYIDGNHLNHEIDNITFKSIDALKIPKSTFLATIVNEECRIPRSYNTVNKASKIGRAHV